MAGRAAAPPRPWTGGTPREEVPPRKSRPRATGPPSPPQKTADGRQARVTALLLLAGIVAAGLRPAQRWPAPSGCSLAIIAMIMLHELGHFVMAKRAGMKVTEFFLGFGPRLWSIRRGETEYGVKAIPAGGYVRIIGMSNVEEVDPADEERTYRSKPYRHRLGVAVAGSTMHFIIAAFLLFLLYAAVGAARPPGRWSTRSCPDSPAQQSDFRVGDRIVAVNGDRGGGMGGRSPATSRPTASRQLVFTVVRKGTGERLDITRRGPEDDADRGRGGAPDRHRPRAVPRDEVRSRRPSGRPSPRCPSYMWQTVKALGGIFSPVGLRELRRPADGRRRRQQQAVHLARRRRPGGGPGGRQRLGRRPGVPLRHQRLRRDLQHGPAAPARRRARGHRHLREDRLEDQTAPGPGRRPAAHADHRRRPGRAGDHGPVGPLPRHRPPVSGRSDLRSISARSGRVLRGRRPTLEA